jgi:Asp-tRNA(Asn)/Glu-tRNA(Gln) amidotransferase A subunit family amidase
MCRSAVDCAMVYDVIRGPDDRDPSTVPVPFRFEASAEWTGVRAAYDAALETDSTEAGRNAFAALDVFRQMGVTLEPVTLPSEVSWSGVISTIIRAESGSAFDPLIQENLDDSLSWQSSRSRANSIRQSRFIPAAEYVTANRHRYLLLQQMDTLMAPYAFLVVRSGSDGAITNLSGHPAITLPSGFRQVDPPVTPGLPTGLSLVGRLYDDGTILAAAAAFQGATGHHRVHPPSFID